MLYQKDCPKCKGVGFEEFEAGLIQVGCSECKGTKKIQLEIPEQKPGQYFCIQCESSHKEDSKLGKSHLQYKAEAQSGEEPDDKPDISGDRRDNQPDGSGDTG